MLAGGHQGAPAPVGATCAGTGTQAGCESPGPSSPPLPGIADAGHSSNLTIAGFVAGLEPATASPARQHASTALASSTRRSVVPPAASRLRPKPGPDRTAASPLAVQPPQPEVAMGTRGPKGLQGGAGSFAGGAGAPSTLIIMLAIALIAARWFWYIRGMPSIFRLPKATAWSAPANPSGDRLVAAPTVSAAAEMKLVGRQPASGFPDKCDRSGTRQGFT